MKIDLKANADLEYGIFLNRSIEELIEFVDTIITVFKYNCCDMTDKELKCFIEQGKEITKILSVLKPQLGKSDIYVDIRVIYDTKNPSKGLTIKNEIYQLITTLESAYTFYISSIWDSAKDYDPYTLDYQDVSRILHNILFQLNDLEAIRTICSN